MVVKKTSTNQGNIVSCLNLFEVAIVRMWHYTTGRNSREIHSKYIIGQFLSEKFVGGYQLRIQTNLRILIFRFK